MSNSTLHTVKSFTESHPAFTEASLRSLIFHSTDRQSSRGPIKGNGLSGAIVRLGRKILIDETKFLEWLASQNGGDRHA